jgi:hypothetical protein
MKFVSLMFLACIKFTGMMALLLLLNFYIALRFGQISDFQAGYQKFYQLYTIILF